jgi:hypothetical protein
MKIVARGQRLRGQLAGLASADHDDRPAAEVPEQPLRQLDRDRGQAALQARDRGFRAHAPAGVQRRREQAIAERAAGPGLARVLVRAANLALDLVLADDHRLKARGDPVEVARRVAVAHRVGHLRELLGRDLRLRGEAAQQRVLCGRATVEDGVDLGAVAARDRDRLADPGLAAEAGRKARGLALGQRDPLAQRDRRDPMGGPQQQQLGHSSSASPPPERRARIRAASSVSSSSSRSMRLSLPAMIAT